MSDTNSTDASGGAMDRFPSLGALRTTHGQLLRRCHESGDSPKFLSEINGFIRLGQATGTLLDDDDDRWAAQSILDYWLTILYRAKQKPADAKLAEFDPEQAPKLADELCPYFGLDAFAPEHHKLFFGRQLLIEKLVGLLLKENRFIAVVGPSGSGKSSLVLAGLLPRLQTGVLHGSQKWRYYSSMVPGSNPLASIARLIQPPGVDSTESTSHQVESFRQDPDYLSKLMGKPGDVPSVLIIDQFEEVFTLCRDDQDRQAFVNNLLGLTRASEGKHIVILTMRTDFESYIQRLPALQAVFEQAQVRVTPLNASELREAIEKPAESVGLKFEQGVVDALLGDTLGEPAGLPLLQFSLLKLWENRERNRVTRDAYKRLGGGRLALARSADEFYEELIPEDQTTAKRILLRLVCPGEGLEVTRYRQRRETLLRIGGGIERVLDRLIQARLVRQTEGDTPADTQVEVAHEALVRNWPKLVEWLDAERVALRQRKRLIDAAEKWRDLGRDSSALLRGSLLDEALLHLQDLDELENEFVQVSKKVQEEKKKEKEKQILREMEAKKNLATEQEKAEVQTKIARRMLYWAIAMSVMFMIAIGVAACVWVLKDNAQHMRYTSAADSLLKEAPQQRELYHRHELAALMTVQAYRFYEGSRKLVDTSFPKNVFISIGKSICNTLKIALNTSSHETLAIPVKQELCKALETSHFSDYLRGDSGNVRAIRFMCKGKKLTSCSATGVVRVWQLKDRSSATLPLSQSDNVSIETATYSSDGKNLALGRGDGTILLYDLQKPSAEPNVLNGHNKSVPSLAFSLDGKKLASGSADGTIRLWDVQKPNAEPNVLKGDNKSVLSLAFSLDGKKLASGSADGTIRLWDVQKPNAEPNVLGCYKKSVVSLSFNPNSKRFLSCSADGTMREWDVTDGNTYEPMPLYFEGNDLSIEYSPLGRYLALGRGDHSIWLWDLEKPNFEYAVLTGHENRVLSVTFSRDEKTLASGDAKGNILKWDLQNEHSDSSRELRKEHMEWLVGRIYEKVFRNLTLSEWRQFVGPDIPYQPTWPDSNNSSLLISAGKNLARDGSIEKAVKYFDEVLKMDPNSSVDPKTEASNKEASNLEESWGFFEQGKEKIANKYDVDGGIEDFDKALKGDPDLKLEIVREKKRLGELLVEKAKEIAIAGDVDSGTEFFAKALKLDPDSDRRIIEAKKAAAQKLAGEAVDNIIEGEVDDAIATYKKAEKLDPTLRKSGPLLNNLCLWGSLWKKPGDVMSFCDQAVGMNQSGGSFHGSRAIARAVKGDVNGAIEDYNKYLKWAESRRRDTTGPQEWLTVLKKGGEITDEMIEKTRHDFIEMTRKQARAMPMISRQSAVSAQ